MADFVENFSCFKPSLPFVEMDPNMELMSQFAELNASVLENPCLDLMGFSNDNFLSQHPNFAMPYVDNSPTILPVEHKPIPTSRSIVSIEDQESQGDKRRKVKAVPGTRSGNSSAYRSEIGFGEDRTKRKMSSGRGKSGRCSSKEVEKPNEVVHVRARRGQATDSHSLAERVRREKINEKMRCLQDLVPGCYKTMGMAGMLDEIINYVQSLQNQVEFLSMKLSAASSFYDFSLDMEAMETPQLGNANEVQEVERLVREGYGGSTSFHSTMPF